MNWGFLYPCGFSDSYFSHASVPWPSFRGIEKLLHFPRRHCLKLARRLAGHRVAPHDVLRRPRTHLEPGHARLERSALGAQADDAEYLWAFLHILILLALAVLHAWGRSGRGGGEPAPVLAPMPEDGTGISAMLYASCGRFVIMDVILCTATKTQGGDALLDGAVHFVLESIVDGIRRTYALYCPEGKFMEIIAPGDGGRGNPPFRKPWLFRQEGMRPQARRIHVARRPPGRHKAF